MRIIRPGAAAIAVLLLGTTAACAQLAPSVPTRNLGAAAGSAATDNPAVNTAQSTPATVPGTPAAAVIQVSPARQALKTTLGIQVDWHTTGSPQVVQAAADKVFDYVVSLGANSVGLNFPFYTDGIRPTKVYAQDGSTPDPATMALVIAAAKQRGLRVLVRPLLNEANLVDDKDDWRGSIEPPSPSTWFASYLAFLKPYLAVAEQGGAQAFDVGTELDSLAPDQTQWSAFDRQASAIFHGRLEYAVNWGRWQQVPSYEPEPEAGVDAYPDFTLPDDATVSQLTAAWVHWLRHQSSSVLAETVIQEVGISAVADAFKNPAATAPSGTPLVPAVQSDWFAAACSAARQLGMAGLYYYAVDSGADPAHAASAAPGSFIGRGDAQIKACFAEGWR